MNPGLLHWEHGVLATGPAGKSPVSFFGMWLFSFPNTIYWRNYSFPSLYSWLLSHKLIDYVHMGLFLGFLIEKRYVSVFMPILYCFDYYNFVMSFKNLFPVSFFCLKKAWAFQSLLQFHTNFRSVFFNGSVKKTLEFW